METDSTLGALLGVTGDAASITLEQLATQHSGLPRLPVTTEVLLRTIVSNFSGDDPYAGDVATLVGLASSADVDQERPYLYSNFGIALLVQALAAAADTDYADLVEQRLLDPMALTATSVPTRPLGGDVTR